MCHYKKGNCNEVTFVLSCPGKKEEIKGEPAAGVTGNNLNTLLTILNQQIGKLASFNRDDVTITNATTKVEYKKKTNKTEASVKELLENDNLKRLYEEIKMTSKFIVCCGNNAKIAVDKVFDYFPNIQAKRVYLPHLGLQGINFKIKKNINGNSFSKKGKDNTKKRLEVVAQNFINQISTQKEV